MPLLAVDTNRTGELQGDAALARSLATLPRNAPVIVMVHGYKYDPFQPRFSPHRRLFARRKADGRSVSWPELLGVGEGGAEPLCIGFGWPARGSLWTAWAEARRVAHPLAGLITRIAARGRKVHLIGHSMGARVCLQAVALAPSGSVGRVVLLTGAALHGEAQAASASPAGRRADFVNITSRENDVFDLAVEALLGLGERTIGNGAGVADPHWLDIQIDAEAARRGLADLGYAIAAPQSPISHWSAYERSGTFDLYRDLLGDPRRLPLGLLRAHLPIEPEARWSRIGAAATEAISALRPSRARGRAAPGR